MAIGLARMFNINLPINFDSPFRAMDRFDHWRRWHISFASFMRQYVFFPLARAKKFRLGNLGALFVTTMLSGFWHGLGATFILWGFAQSLIMMALHYRSAFKLRLGNFTWLKIFTTFCVTLLLGVLFRSPNLSVSLSIFSKMYHGIIGQNNHSEIVMDKIIFAKLIFMALVIWGLPNTQRFFGKYWSAIDQRQSIPKHTAPDLLPGAKYLRFAPTKTWAAVTALLFIAVLLSMGKASRFIYYQF